MKREEAEAGYVMAFGKVIKKSLFLVFWFYWTPWLSIHDIVLSHRITNASNRIVWNFSSYVYYNGCRTSNLKEIRNCKTPNLTIYFEAKLHLEIHTPSFFKSFNQTSIKLNLAKILQKIIPRREKYSL